MRGDHVECIGWIKGGGAGGSGEAASLIAGEWGSSLARGLCNTHIRT